MIPAKTSPARRAFTLVELLVATAISVIIVLGVVSIATYSIKAYDNANALVSATATARTVLDTLETDIQSAILREDGTAWMECLPSTPEGGATRLADRTNLPKGADMQLQFFASPVDRDRVKPGKTRDGSGTNEYKGETCAIRYRILLRNPLPSSLQPDTQTDRLFCLTRTLANPEDTFNIIIPSTQTKDSSGLSQNYWKNGPVGSGSGAIQDKRTSTPDTYRPADLLATNVIGLTPIFVFRATDTSGTTPVSYQYCMTPSGDISIPDWLNPAGVSGKNIAYSSPEKAGVKPGSNNLFTTDLKIAASWCAADQLAAKNSALAEQPSGTSGKYQGKLCAVILSLVVLDDTGADRVRALMNQPVREKIPDDEWDRIYAEHAHFFTRRVELVGR